MKKLILLVCVLFISSQSFSQIFVEDFDYVAGTVISTTAVWDVSSAGGTNPIATTFPGLTFPFYIGSAMGNAVRLATNGEDDSASFFAPQTTGSVYASFMVTILSAQSAGDYFFALSTTGNAFDARVYVRSSGAGFNFGTTKANEAIISWGPAVYSFGVTYLVVDKYTFNGGVADDQVSLFVYDPSSPPPNLEPSPTIGPISATSTDAINLSRVILRQGAAANAGTMIVDGIYVDLSWNSQILPVELASFTSVINNRDVTLNWSTNSESNNSGFDIERLASGSGSIVNSEWSKVGNVSGNGTSTVPHNYSFSDRGLATGNYSYRLKQIDFNGNFEYFNLSNEVVIGVPSRYELSQNYPNPFNPTTNINFDLPFDGNVSIKLFDISGKEVATLVNEVKTAGYYSVAFNASDFSSGVYFYTLSAKDFASTKRMLLIK